MSNKEVFDLSAFKGLPIPGSNGHTIRVHGHGVDARDDEIRLLHLSRPPRSAGRQSPGGIKNGELGFDDRGQVGQCQVDVVLGVETLSVPDQAHEALDAQANPRGRMRFGYGEVDEHLALQNFLQDLDTFYSFPLRDSDCPKEFFSARATT